MKNVIKSLAALAASLLAFNACNREVLPVEPSETHSLSFVADVPQTKTSVSREGDEAVYEWSIGDEDRFTVYEINGDVYSAAQSLDAVNVDGQMIITATFNGTAHAGSKYFALFNSGVQTSQNATNTSYDQASDVLISEVVTSSSIDDDDLVLCFKRETAFGLMTAKNLEGSYMLGASVTADKVLAADYDHEARAFEVEGSNTITVFDSGDPISEVEGGQSPIFFATIPVDDAILTVAIVTGDENGDFQAAYEKTFTKTISFARGDVHAFGTSLADNKVTSLTLDLSTDHTTTASENELSWDRTFISVIAAKANATVNTNNYYPGTSGKTYTSTRFYTGSTLTFTPKLGLSINEIVYTATTEAFANAFQSSQWSNATASVSGKVVTVIPTEGNNAISVTIGANTGAESIVIRYGIPVQPTTHTVTIDPAIANGTVTAEPFANVLPGTEITLTVDPDDGYEFGTWNVTNAETEEEIAVSNNKFTMPNADVNVSATFEKVGTTIVTTMSAANDADIKFVTGSSSAANAFWANSTPLTANDITLSGSVTSGTNYSYYDGSVVRFYANNNIIITPSNGATITKVEIVRQSTTSSNTGTINCDNLTASSENTTTNTNVYEGETKSAVTFTNTAQARFTKIIVYSKGGKTLETVTVSGAPTKTTYVAGDSFDPAGLTVTGTYDDRSEETITEGITWSTPAALTAGQTSVLITATVKGVTSDAYEVTRLTVTAPATIVSISALGTPAEFWKGDSFNHNGITIKAIWSDETETDVTSLCAFNGYDMNTPGQQKVTVTYQEKTCQYDIEVKTIANTEETAYTVTEAKAIIDAGKDLNTPVYVKGIVSQIVSAYSSQYGNISFNVSEDGKTTGDQFQFYRNFKGANNTKWTDADTKPAVGNEVIGYGTLYKHTDGTYEFTAGNYLVYLKEMPYLRATTSDNITSIAAGGATITVNVATNVDNWTAVSDNPAFTISNQTATSFKVNVSENTSTTDGRSATITVSADGVDDVVIDMTQSKKSAGGDPVTVTWTASSATGNPGNGNDWLSGSIDGNISWSATKGGSNNPKYYDTGTGLRVYNGGTFTVSAANDKKITKIILTFSATGYTFSTSNTNQTQTYEFDPSVESNTWSVSRTCRLQKVEVTYK